MSYRLSKTDAKNGFHTTLICSFSSYLGWLSLMERFDLPIFKHKVTKAFSSGKEIKYDPIVMIGSDVYSYRHCIEIAVENAIIVDASTSEKEKYNLISSSVNHSQCIQQNGKTYFMPPVTSC